METDDEAAKAPRDGDIGIAEFGLRPCTGESLSFDGIHSEKGLAGITLHVKVRGDLVAEFEQLFKRDQVEVRDPFAGRTYSATIRLRTTSSRDDSTSRTYTIDVRELDPIPTVTQIEIEEHTFPALRYSESGTSRESLNRHAVLKLSEDQLWLFRDFQLRDSDTVRMRRVGIDEKPLSVRLGGNWYWSKHEDDVGKPYFKQLASFFPLQFESSRLAQAVHTPATIAGFLVVELTARFEALVAQLTQSEVLSAQARDSILAPTWGKLVDERRVRELLWRLANVDDAETHLA